MKRLTAIFLSILMLSVLFAGCEQQTSDTEERQYYLVDDFEGKKIGVIENNVSADEVKDKIPRVEVKSYKTLEDAVSDLKEHKVEGIVIDAATANPLVEQDETLGKIVEPFLEREYVMGVTFGDTPEESYKLRTDATLSRIQGDGTYDQLVEKYFSNGDSPDVTIEYNQGTVEGRLLKVGVCSDIPPFCYKNSSGDFVGLNIDIANQVAKTLGADIEFQEYSAQDLPSALENGEVNMIIGKLTEEDINKIEGNINPSEPYYDDSQYLVVNKADRGPIPDFNNPQ